MLNFQSSIYLEEQEYFGAAAKGLIEFVNAPIR